MHSSLGKKGRIDSSLSDNQSIAQSERDSNQNTTSTDSAGAASGTIALAGSGTSSSTDATTSATVEQHNYQYEEIPNQWYFVQDSWKQLLDQKTEWMCMRP